MTISEQREAVTHEARTWLGTKFRDAAMVKGQHGGVDCSQLIRASYAGRGIPERIDLPPYNLQFMLNRKEESYIEEIRHWFREIKAEETQAADVCLLRWGHIYSHGMILLAPWAGAVIHALNPLGVILGDASRDGRILASIRKYRDSPPRFFRPIGW